MTRGPVGEIAARAAELGLDDVPDPREGKTDWRLATVLKACIIGMAPGCKGLGVVEDRTALLGRGAREALGLWRRLPDTIARNPLCRLEPDRVRCRMAVSATRSAASSGTMTFRRVWRRWSVEEQNHNTFGTAFAEDDRPWIVQPRRMVVVVLLRRLTYNPLTRYRAVTLRSERSRTTSRPTLMRTVYKALLQASEGAMAGVRHRVVIAD